ncbi:MAG: hypothetical protein ACRC6T_01370 [Sarcina sp.]
MKSKVTWVCKKCKASVEEDREVCHICDTNKFGTPVRYKTYSGKEVYVRFNDVVAKLEKTKEVLGRFYLA